MAKKNVDLSKLKDEIKSRKESTQHTAVLDENKQKSTIPIQPKDNFLNNLMQSLETGRENEASRVVKLIENKAALKDGEERSTDGFDESRIKSPSQHSNPSEPKRLTEDVFDDTKREDRLYEEMMAKQKARLAEGYNQSYYQQQGKPQQQYGGNNMNQDELFENIFNRISEQFDSKIIEMYSYERIKNVLYENKDLIKSLVIEVIKELREKNKK
ncbi:MAG: hypothetical protein ACOCVF_00385 [bacterium]